MRRREFITLIVGALVEGRPLAARAQQGERMRRIGVLAVHEHHLPEFEGLREQLRELAHVEGKDLVLDWQYASEGSELPVLAKKLVDLHPDVLVSISTPATIAVRAVAGDIPIVFANVADPVTTGFVASLAHPGGNMTGESLVAPELTGKRLELLKEIVPTCSNVAVMWNASNPGERLQWPEAQKAAAVLGMRLTSIEVRTASDIGSSFDIVNQQGADGLVVLPDPLTSSHRPTIVELAAKARIPALYSYREFVDDGGLLAYGPNARALFRRVAIYVDKILKGTKPADLPVGQPTKFELVINLKTAKALGITVPTSLLIRADEMIE